MQKILCKKITKVKILQKVLGGYIFETPCTWCCHLAMMYDVTVHLQPVCYQDSCV